MLVDLPGAALDDAAREIGATAIPADLTSREDVRHLVAEAAGAEILIEPEEVADAVVYLCRPAAWTMTGSVLTMDAGWLAH